MSIRRSRFVSSLVALVLVASGLLAASPASAANTGSISGSVTGTTGVTFTLSGAEARTTTDLSGSYSFGALADGTYTVLPSKSGFAFAPASITVTVTGGAAITTGTDFAGAAAGTVTGIAFNDVNVSATRDAGDFGQPNIVVFADLNTNNTFDLGEPNTVSGANGAYALTGVPAGARTIRMVPPGGGSPTVVSTTANVVANGTSAAAGQLGAHFTSAVIGQVRREGGPIAGGYIGTDRNGDGTISGDEYVTSDASGNYAIQSVPLGKITFGPAPLDFYGIYPLTRLVTLDSPATIDHQDFDYYRYLLSKGYTMVASDGGVFNYGPSSVFHGSTGNIKLNQPIVGAATKADGSGYYFVASDGGVFAFGGAKFYGSLGATKLNKPIVAMALTADEKGYYLFASDGGVFAFGQTLANGTPAAPFLGSLGATRLNKPIVGGWADKDGTGYTMVASDGGIFNFQSQFYGSAGATRLNSPIVGGAPDPDGTGYTLVAADGGIFNYASTFYGSAGALRLNKPIVGMSYAPTGRGYYLVASDGGIFSYPGNEVDAPLNYYGSAGDIKLNRPIVAIAAL